MRVLPASTSEHRQRPGWSSLTLPEAGECSQVHGTLEPNRMASIPSSEKNVLTLDKFLTSKIGTMKITVSASWDYCEH